MSPSLPSSPGRFEFGLRRKLYLALAVIVALLAVEAVLDVRESWNAMGAARRIAVSIDVANDLARSVRDLAFERGRTNAVLHSPNPVSREDRDFIRARRAAGTASLNIALRRLSDRSTKNPPSSATATRASELSAAIQSIELLRNQVDRALERPFAERDATLVADWYPAMTHLLSSIAVTLAILDDIGNTPAGDIRVLARLRTSAAEYRLVAGAESATLAQAVAARLPLLPGQIEKINELRGRIAVYRNDIRRNAEILADREVLNSVQRALVLNDGQFAAMRARVFAAGTAGDAYPVTLSDYGRQSVAALDAMIEVVETASRAAADSAGRRYASAKNEFIRSLCFFLIALGASAAILIIMSRHVVRPIERITHSLRHGSGTQVEELTEIGRRQDEIGTMSRVIGDYSAEIQAGRAALEASEARLQFLLSSSPAVMYSRSSGGACPITFVSQNVKICLGYEPEDFVGNPRFWSENVHPDDIAEAKAGLDGIEARTVHTVDYRFRGRGGAWQWIRDSVAAVRAPDGTIAELVGAWIDVTAQKGSIQALRDLNATLGERVIERTALLAESERFNRATLDALGAMVAVTDENGVIVATNAAWRQIASLNGGDATKTGEGANYISVCDAATGDSRAEGEAVAAAIRDIAGGRRSEFAIEYSCLRREKLYWFQCRITRFQHQGPVRLVIAHEDVTAVHTATDMLAANERMFSSLAEVSPTGIFRTDADGQCEFVNRRWTEITGLTADEARGNGWQEAIHPDDRTHVIEHWRAAVRARAPFRFEYRFCDRSNRVTWVIGQAREITNPDGTVGGYVGAITDVTDLKAAETRLSESEARFRGVVEHVPIALVVKSRERRFLTANPAWERLYGLNETAIVGKTTFDIFPGRSRNEESDRQESDVFETGKANTREVVRTLPDGEEHHLVVTKFPIFGPDGAMQFIGGFVQDVTDAWRAERALRESEQRFRGVIEFAPVPLSVKTLDRKFAMVNPAWQRLYGLMEDQVLGRIDAEIIEDQTPRRKIEVEEDDVIKTRSVSIAFRSRTLGDGHPHELVITKFPIIDSAGDVAFIGTYVQDVTESMISERALRESEAQLRSIIDNLPISLDVRDLQSQYLLLNRSCAEWYGIREHDALGRTNAELFPERPINNALSAEADAEVLRTRRRHVRESERTLADGKKHLLEITKFPIVGPSGQLLSIGSFVADVTDRRLTERALRLLSTSLATVWGQEFFDTLTRLLANLLGGDVVVVGEIVGKKRGHVRTRSVFENGGHVAGFEYDIAGTPSAEVVTGGSTVVSGDMKALFPKSTYLARMEFVSYVGVPLRAADGESIGHLAVMSRRPLDNPELAPSVLDLFATRASAELQRAQLEARFRDLFESSPDGLILTDGSGHITDMNREAESLFGYDHGELIGSKIEALVPEASRRGHVKMREEYVALPVSRRMNVRSVNLKALRKDGTSFPVDINLSPIRLGETVSVVASIRDISEKIATEQQLLHAQKMEAIGEMTGGLAHDFNNLLAVIITNLEMISERADDDPFVRRLLERAVEASERSSLLVQRLLAFSRKQSLSPEAIDLNQLVERTRQLLIQPLGAEIAIRFERRDGLWLCRADVAQVETVIINLAINARDAMPSGGVLTISCENVTLTSKTPVIGASPNPGDYVMLAVGDTGTGMTPETMERCIEPFYTTKDVGKGSGLGLSMVFGFANQSGGYLAIESSLGHGTTVRIYLPRIQGDTAAKRKAKPTDTRTAAPPADNRQRHVLVVEDNPDLRTASVAAIEAFGYRATSAEDATTALAVFAANPDIEIIFSDIILPGGMNGVKLAEEAVRQRAETKVLLATGYSGEALAERDAASPGWRVLKKPYRMSDLRDALRRLVDVDSPET